MTTMCFQQQSVDYKAASDITWQQHFPTMQVVSLKSLDLKTFSEVITNHVSRFLVYWQQLGWLWGPPSFIFNGYRCSFLGTEQAGHDGDHSPPSSGETRNGCSYTSTTPVCLHGIDKGKFTFHLFFIHFSKTSDTGQTYFKHHFYLNKLNLTC